MALCIRRLSFKNYKHRIMNQVKAKYLIVLPVFFLLAFLLSLIFGGQIILPQSFSLGPLTVHYYGLTMALAVASGFYLAIKRASAFGISSSQAEDLLFWLIVFGFLGARLYHIFSSIAYYRLHPIDMFKVWNGGLSIYGALLGGLLPLLVLAKSYKLKAISLLDWLTPSIIIGQIIGRIGNLFNYEAFGYPTNLPWKMFVPFKFRPAGLEAYQFFHPFFLYEIIGSLAIFFVIKYVIEPKANRPLGQLFITYILLYNSVRFSLEFLRTDSTFLGTFRLNAISSFILAVAAALILIFLKVSPDTSELENSLKKMSGDMKFLSTFKKLTFIRRMMVDHKW